MGASAPTSLLSAPAPRPHAFFDIVRAALALPLTKGYPEYPSAACNGRRLQLPASPLRAHYVKACVKVREYPDGTLAVFHGPRRIARYDAEGAELLVPTAGSLTPCSPPSRRGLVAAEFAASASRRPALTAAARGVPAPARVGTWRNRGVTTAGTGWSPRNAKGARPCPRVTSMSASMCP